MEMPDVGVSGHLSSPSHPLPPPIVAVVVHCTLYSTTPSGEASNRVVEIHADSFALSSAALFVCTAVVNQSGGGRLVTTTSPLYISILSAGR